MAILKLMWMTIFHIVKTVTHDVKWAISKDMIERTNWEMKSMRDKSEIHLKYNIVSSFLFFFFAYVASILFQMKEISKFNIFPFSFQNFYFISFALYVIIFLFICMLKFRAKFKRKIVKKKKMKWKKETTNSNWTHALIHSINLLPSSLGKTEKWKEKKKKK